MDDEIQRLVREGLFEENLAKIRSLCHLRFKDSPAVFGTLMLICGVLEDEFDGQGIPTARYSTINDVLQEPVVRLIDSAAQSPETILDCLNAVHIAFMSLDE